MDEDNNDDLIGTGRGTTTYVYLDDDPVYSGGSTPTVVADGTATIVIVNTYAAEITRVDDGTIVLDDVDEPGLEFDVEGYDEEDVVSFADEMAKMKAFPDSKEGMEQIRALGIKVCALSNVDNDIITESFRHEGIVMDAIVTAEDVQCYKPHYEGFLKSQEVMGCTADEMHHAAFGFKYDCVPGNALGYTTVWIRRGDMLRDAFDLEDICVGDLKTYATYLKGLKAIDEENGFYD